MADKPKTMQDWLKEIYPDQNLKQLSDLEDIDWQYLRNMFLSMMIEGNFNIGSIHPDSNRIIPGIPSPLTDSEFSTASVAALTMTCPANRRRRVYYAGAVNQTQASLVNLTGVIGGNTLAVPMVISNTNATTRYNVVIGGPSNSAAGVEGSLKEIWLEAGDTLTLTCGTFVATNNTEHIFLFEEFRA